MFVIVCYDITDNKRRTKVMKAMKSLGFHVQKSVFECYLTEDKIDYLEKRLMKLIKLEEDSVRIYILPEHMVDQMRIVGIGQINKIPKLMLF